MRARAMLCVCGAAAAAALFSPAAPARAGLPLLARAGRVRAVAELPSTATRRGAEGREAKKKQRLNVRIDDEWYDLTNWRAAHPAGAHWIDAYKDADATEVMYGFHSDQAMSMMRRLPKSKNPPELPPPVESSYKFREFRAKLLANGWFQPHWRGEIQKLLPYAGCVAAAR